MDYTPYLYRNGFCAPMGRTKVTPRQPWKLSSVIRLGKLAPFGRPLLRARLEISLSSLPRDRYKVTALTFNDIIIVTSSSSLRCRYVCKLALYPHHAYCNNMSSSLRMAPIDAVSQRHVILLGKEIEINRTM